MLKCEKCKREIEENLTLCPYCGHPVINSSLNQKSKKTYGTKEYIIVFAVIISIIIGFNAVKLFDHPLSLEEASQIYESSSLKSYDNYSTFSKKYPQKAKAIDFAHDMLTNSSPILTYDNADELLFMIRTKNKTQEQGLDEVRVTHTLKYDHESIRSRFHFSGYIEYRYQLDISYLVYQNTLDINDEGFNDLLSILDIDGEDFISSYKQALEKELTFFDIDNIHIVYGKTSNQLIFNITRKYNPYTFSLQ